MAKPVYKRIFDDVFMVTSAEKRIRSSVFALYFGENTPDVSLWGLNIRHGKVLLWMTSSTSRQEGIQGAFELTQSQRELLTYSPTGAPIATYLHYILMTDNYFDTGRHGPEGADHMKLTDERDCE